MARKKNIDLKSIEEDIRSKFDLVQKLTENPTSVKKTKVIKDLISSILQYKINAKEACIKAYKIFKINGYEQRFRHLADLVINRLKAYANLPSEKLKIT